MINSLPIGIFDSGIGGLSVVKALAKELPNENVIYLGDNARTPYGIKSKATIIQYALEDVNFLTKLHVKALVVACHTISASALPELKQEIEMPIIGMALPMIDMSIVVATEATIESGAYHWATQTIACSSLVTCIENGEPTQEVINSQLSCLQGKTTSLLLGCTHLAFVKEEIHRSFGSATTIFDPALSVARQLKRILSKRALLNHSTGGQCICYFTGAGDKARQRIESLNLNVEEVHPCVSL